MSPVLLVGIDCSECGDRAVEYAIQQARLTQARLIIAHIIEWSQFSFSTVEENAQRHKRREEEIRRAHAEIIDPIVAKLTAEGLDVEGLVRHGHVADTLDRLARKHGVTNIILGRNGDSRFKKKMFGSVGSHLVQAAECAVTVVP
ncbi:MAG: universal stress protein [Lysobacterales bacterium]|jgi:nucleotide-binding universal stress UspA family protein